MRRVVVLSIALFSAGHAWGQYYTSEETLDEKWGFFAKQKFLAGDQDYRSSDTFLELDLPYGFNLNAGGNVYESETSSPTPTFTFGGGVNRDQWSLGASYSITGLANDMRSTAVDVSASASSSSKEFRTTVGANVNVTHMAILVRGPRVTSEIGLRQRTPTIDLKQRLYKTTLTCSLSESTYDKNVQLLSEVLTRFERKHPRLAGSSGLGGLIQGFPDWSAKFGLYQDLWDWPATLWGTYDTVHLLDTAGLVGATSDCYSAGLDTSFTSWLNASVQYSYLRQTSAAITRRYGFSLSVAF